MQAGQKTAQHRGSQTPLRSSDNQSQNYLRVFWMGIRRKLIVIQVRRPFFSNAAEKMKNHKKTRQGLFQVQIIPNQTFCTFQPVPTKHPTTGMCEVPCFFEPSGRELSSFKSSKASSREESSEEGKGRRRDTQEVKRLVDRSFKKDIIVIIIVIFRVKIQDIIIQFLVTNSF